MAEPVKVELHVLDISQNSVTGHIDMNAVIVETLDDGSEVSGPVETHGIDPLALETRYGPVDDPVKYWLQEVKSTMVGRHEIRKLVHSDLHTMIGKRV